MQVTICPDIERGTKTGLFEIYGLYEEEFQNCFGDP